MELDELLDERERLSAQRMAVLEAMAPPVAASDLDADRRDDLRTAVEQALDDAFFPLTDPVDTEIEERRASFAVGRRRADLIDIRARQ